jgi:hypothetical protein
MPIPKCIPKTNARQKPELDNVVEVQETMAAPRQPNQTPGVSRKSNIVKGRHRSIAVGIPRARRRIIA